VESATVESATVESATAMATAAAMEPAAAVEPAMATATVHLRVGGSDTAKNRERRDTCDCKFLHPRLSHGRTPSLLPKNKPAYPLGLGVYSKSASPESHIDVHKHKLGHIRSF
jgi:hypothetical protein